MIEPLRIEASEAQLDDLKNRLANARWTDDFDNDDWAYGANTDYIRKLTGYWLTDYDWRRTEQAINRFDHFRMEIAGAPIHFMHVKGKGPVPMPLMLNHGWPWTFWDFKKVIGPLTDPAAHGGDPEDAFEIVAPSLPGYGYSTPLRRSGVNSTMTGDMWAELMTRLGHERFATQGADWGAIVSANLGHKYADRVIGVHIQLLTPLDYFTGGAVDPALFSEGEAWMQARNAHFFQNESGYYALQSTRPQTPAIALNDSPVGLLAWIVEKRRNWSDCDGDVEKRFTKDELIDTVMIYWLTESFGTSARYYYEAAHRPWTPSHERRPVVEAPTAVAVFPKEVVLQPHDWAKEYYNLKRWTKMNAGGHFGPMEEPAALVEDLRAFFRDYR